MDKRPSAYPTIEAASDKASELARAQRKIIVLVADQPHDGGFTIGDEGVFESDAVYLKFDRNGDPMDGPRLKELPIDFAGALPVK